MKKVAMKNTNKNDLTFIKENIEDIKVFKYLKNLKS
jgi:hypothetical protein